MDVITVPYTCVMLDTMTAVFWSPWSIRVMFPWSLNMMASMVSLMMGRSYDLRFLESRIVRCPFEGRDDSEDRNWAGFIDLWKFNRKDLQADKMLKLILKDMME